MHEFTNDNELVNQIILTDEKVGSIAKIAFSSDRNFVACRKIIDKDAKNFYTVEVTDTFNEKLFVKLPLNIEASKSLEKEIKVLEFLKNKSELKFRFPQIVGKVDLSAKFYNIDTVATVIEPFWGQPINPVELNAEQTKELAIVLAGIHTISINDVEAAGFKSMTTKQCRDRQVQILDRLAITGKAPTGLLSRWEEFLTDENNWAFATTTIHGHLTPANILFTENEVSYVNGFKDLQVGDPAYDLAGITPTLTFENNELFYKEYHKAVQKRNHALGVDETLEARAEFYAGFELAEKLLLAHETHQIEKEELLSVELHLLDEKLRLGVELAFAKSREEAAAEAAAQLEQRHLVQDGLHTQKIDRETTPIVNQEETIAHLAQMANEPATEPFSHTTPTQNTEILTQSFNGASVKAPATTEETEILPENLGAEIAAESPSKEIAPDSGTTPVSTLASLSSLNDNNSTN